MSFLSKIVTFLDKLYKYAAQSEHYKLQNSISSVSQQYKRQQWERGGQT